MKSYVLIACCLLAIGSSSCKKKSVPCVMGTLLGSTCAGGYLIQVDTTSQHTIGQNVAFQGDAGSPLPGPAAKARVYSNVIMTYSALPPEMPRGQKFYFQYKPDTDKSSRICTANVSWYQAPLYKLLGTSTASCAALLPE